MPKGEKQRDKSEAKNPGKERTKIAVPADFAKGESPLRGHEKKT